MTIEERAKEYAKKKLHCEGNCREMKCNARQTGDLSCFGWDAIQKEYKDNATEQQ